MNIPSGQEMNRAPQANEEIGEYKWLPIQDAEALKTHIDEIADLAYDASDDSDNPRSFGDHAARGLDSEYLKEGQHGKLFALQKGEQIVALAMVRAPEDANEVVVERILLADRFKQKHIFQELLLSLRKEFPEGRYPDIQVLVDAEKPPRKDLVDALKANHVKEGHISLRKKPPLERAA